jgi:hypothetical protein
VLGLAWSKDPKRYARGSVATGRVYHADSSKAMTLVLLARGWPLGPTSSRKNTLCRENLTNALDGTDTEDDLATRKLKPKNTMGERRPEGRNADPTNMRLDETKWGYRRMEKPLEVSQGPEGAVAPYVDGRTSVCSCQLSFRRCCTLLRGADKTCPLEATLSRQTVSGHSC